MYKYLAFWCNEPHSKLKMVRIKAQKPIIRSDEKYFEGVTQAAKEMQLNRRSLCLAVQRNRLYGGFKWKYYEDPDLLGEIWKTNRSTGIRVSNLGRVFMKKTNRKDYGYKRADGYRVVHQGKYGLLVHTVVADTFLTHQKLFAEIRAFPKRKKVQVHHKDHNRSNNCITNLQWVTPSENMFANQ